MSQQINFLPVSIKYVFLDVVNFTMNRTIEAQGCIITAINNIVQETLEKSRVLTTRKRILLPTGDGICLALIDLKEYDIHIKLALEILKGLQLYNLNQTCEERKFTIRIGVNENNSDTIVTDINNKKNVAGLGINMAQRIMSCADGNQLLVGEVVYDGNLSQRHKYSNKFKKFRAKDKHGNTFRVYQYINPNLDYLNSEIPKQFSPPKRKEKKLSLYQAYYFAYCLKNLDFLKSVQNTPKFKSASFLLLNNLARDAISLEEWDGYHSIKLITYKAGKAAFNEQYEYYLSKVDQDIQDLTYRTSISLLSDVAYCFEKEQGRSRNFIFLTIKGKQKLLHEHKNIMTRLP